MVFVYDLIHIEINFFRHLDSVLDLNGLFSQDLYLFRHLDILDSFRARNLPDDLDFNRLLNFHFDNLRNSNRLCDRFLFLYYLRHFDNVLNYLFSNYWFLDDEFHRDLVLERNHNFSVLDSNFMHFDQLFNDSVSEHFYRNLPDDFGGYSPFNLNLFCHLFFHYYFDNLLSFDNFDFLNIFYNWFFNDDFFNYLDFFNNWNFSEYFNYLKTWNLYSNYFLYYSWDLYNFLYDSWYWNYLFYYLLNFNNSWNFNDLFYDFIHKHSFCLNYLFFNNNRNRYLDSNFFNDFFSDWYDSCNFLINNFWLWLNIWHLHFNINWLLFLEIQRHDFFNLKLLGNKEFLSVGFLHNYFNLFYNFLSVPLDKVSHLNNNFLLNLFDNFFFLNHRNLNDFLFNNSIRDNFLNDFGHIDFSFFSVCNESRYFSV